MPRALALALSASSNGLGTRMLICSSFFSSGNFLCVHIAGRHWANEAAAVFRPQSKGHKHRPPGTTPSHGNHAVFVLRVFRVGRDAGSVSEQRLDLCDGNAVFLALRAVAAVPVKSRYP